MVRSGKQIGAKYDRIGRPLNSKTFSPWTRSSSPVPARTAQEPPIGGIPGLLSLLSTRPLSKLQLEEQTVLLVMSCNNRATWQYWTDGFSSFKKIIGYDITRNQTVTQKCLLSTTFENSSANKDVFSRHLTKSPMIKTPKQKKWQQQNKHTLKIHKVNL